MPVTRSQKDAGGAPFRVPLHHEEPPRSPTVQRTEESTITTAAPPQRAMSKSRASTSKSTRARRIAEAQEEIARRSLELAQARLAVLQTEDSDSEDSCPPEPEIAETVRARTEQWVDTSLTAAEPERPAPIETEHQRDVLPPVIATAVTTTAVTPAIVAATLKQAPLPPQPQAALPPPPRMPLPPPETPAVPARRDDGRIFATPQPPTYYVMRPAPVELPTFNGAYTEWLNFKRAYEESSVSLTPTENIARLRRALKGRAREEIAGLLIVGAKPEEMMRALENTFGSTDTIAQIEFEKLEKLARPTDSPRDICLFANRVYNIVVTLRALDAESYYADRQALRKLVEKIPPSLRYRWFDFKKSLQQKANLEAFADFLNIEAESCREYAPPENIQPEGHTPQHRRQVHRTHTATDSSPTACPACGDTSHSLSKCQAFIKADSDGRWSIAKSKNLCYRCLNLRSPKHRCKRQACEEDGCQRTHHRLLHFVKKSDTEVQQPTVNHTVASASITSSSYLKIIPVRISSSAGYIDTHALLDDGSTVTLIDADTAALIGAEGQEDPLCIDTIMGANKRLQSQRVTLQLRGTSGKKFSIKARTIKHLNLASQKIDGNDVTEAPHLQEIIQYISTEEAQPKLLIGQDNWSLLIADEVLRGSNTQPTASLTPLGWVLHGATTRSLGRQIHYVSHIAQIEEKIDEERKQFFALESLCIEPKKPKSDPNEAALKILQENTVPRTEGGYETALLWKTQDTQLPNNYESALKRLQSTERKLDREPQLREQYEKNIENLLQRGYAEPAPAQATTGRTWYLPHFAVTHPAKPGKVRVVYDAAARYAGHSLNDHLCTGPDLLQSLPGVLMRFRQHEVAVAADIEEMFLRIGIREEDRDALRFLWRGRRREGPPLQYRMKSVIFGAACSPCTALFVKNHNAEIHRDEYPEAAEAIIKNHYMDDYLQSFPSVEEAVKIANDVQQVHRKANFNLRKWTSNRTEVIEAIATDKDRTSENSQNISLGTALAEKVLGLTWRPSDDVIGFNLSFNRVPTEVIDGQRTPTKREALKTVMSLFDPLGLVSPITIQAKQMLQETWRAGTAWDAPLPKTEETRWIQWVEELKKLRNLNLPRQHPHLTDAVNKQVHVFVDASETAYAAAVYWRVTDSTGHVFVSLAAAKAKVAPIKLTSIPRLELQAAVMGVRLAAAVIDEYQLKPDSRHYWSDSRTVLSWLRAGPRAFKPFVGHRVAEIEDQTAVNEWRWVPSGDNVADDATRDIPLNFDASHRWFIGPSFLYRSEEGWPTETTTPTAQPTGEERSHHLTSRKSKITDALPDVHRFSSWLRLVLTTARVLQFIASRAQWRRAQRLADHFWSRWLREYLPELQQRREPQGKGERINIGDVVIIADGNLPRNTWPRGRVTATYPGPDGETRVVDVRTEGGVLRRPVKKLIVLRSSNSDPAPE